MSMTWDFILRLFVAGALGTVIGLDREYRAKEAGYRTHFLVSLGSALIMIVSQYGFMEVVKMEGIDLDPSRVVIGARQTDDGFIEMFVRDFGKGIDPRYHKSIFDHYFRVPGTKVQGSGLGLSISRDFVEAHNGTLTVDSKLGEGSMFVMRLKA